MPGTDTSCVEIGALDPISRVLLVPHSHSTHPGTRPSNEDEMKLKLLAAPTTIWSRTRPFPGLYSASRDADTDGKGGPSSSVGLFTYIPRLPVRCLGIRSDLANRLHLHVAIWGCSRVNRVMHKVVCSIYCSFATIEFSTEKQLMCTSSQSIKMSSL